MELSVRRGAQVIEWTAAALLTVALVALHLTVLTHAGPLWRDEISSLRLATMPTIAEFWSSLVYDPFPALYFFILRCWSGVGLATNDFDLRLLGYAIGLLLLIVLWLGGWRITKSAPLWPLAIFALNPVTIQFGDSVRAYGLGLIWNVLSFVAIWQFVFHPWRWRIFLLAVVSTILSVQSLFPNALFVFAVCIGGMVVSVRRGRRAKAAQVFSIGLIAAASLLPYISIFGQTREWSPLCVSDVTFKAILISIYRTLGIASPVMAYAGIALVAIGMAFAIRSQWKQADGEAEQANSDSILFAVTVLIVAIVTSVLFFLCASWTPSVWYFLPLFATATLCLHVLLQTQNPWARIAQSMLFLVLFAVVLPSGIRHATTRMTNADIMAQRIASKATKDDLIIVNPYFYAISFNRYYRGAAPVVAVPDLNDTSLHRWDLLKHAMTVSDPMQQLRERIVSTLQGGHFVYLVGGFPWHVPAAPSPLPPAPHPKYGWYVRAYLHNWETQISYLTEQQSTAALNIYPENPETVNDLEMIGTVVFRGWRNPDLVRK